MKKNQKKLQNQKSQKRNNTDKIFAFYNIFWALVFFLVSLIPFLGDNKSKLMLYTISFILLINAFGSYKKTTWSKYLNYLIGEIFRFILPNYTNEFASYDKDPESTAKNIYSGNEFSKTSIINYLLIIPGVIIMGFIVVIIFFLYDFFQVYFR